jgi:hypothetical protein
MSRQSPRLLWVGLALMLGCGHEWDDYDPRLAGSGGAGASATVSSTSAVTTGAGAGPSTGASVSSGAGAAGGAASGPGGSGSGAGGGGGMPSSCSPNGTTALTDAFDDGAIAAEWTTYQSDPGIEIVEEGGALRITVPADPTIERYAHLIAAGNYAFSDCSVAVRIVEVPTSTGFSGLLLVSSVGFDDRIEIAFASGSVVFRYWLLNMVTELGSVPYTPSEHAWFRLRDAGGITHWETSGDGVNFVTHHSLRTPFDASSGQPALFGGASGGMRPTGAMRFDDFNLLP